MVLSLAAGVEPFRSFGEILILVSWQKDWILVSRVSAECLRCLKTSPGDSGSAQAERTALGDPALLFN